MLFNQATITSSRYVICARHCKNKPKHFFWLHCTHGLLVEFIFMCGGGHCLFAIFACLLTYLNRYNLLLVQFTLQHVFLFSIFQICRVLSCITFHAHCRLKVCLRHILHIHFITDSIFVKKFPPQTFSFYNWRCAD